MIRRQKEKKAIVRNDCLLRDAERLDYLRVPPKSAETTRFFLGAA